MAIFTLSAASNACVIDVKLKKSTAKTGYFNNGEKMSLKTLGKTGCKINKILMTPKQVNTLKIKTLKKKLAKLQGGN